MRYFSPLAWICLLLLTSCAGISPTREMQAVDSLTTQAYSYRYIDLDSTYAYAKRAYDRAKFHKQGKAEAANLLGFYAYMRLDFDMAMHYYKEVSSLSKNEVELLIADVGLMKIYQRVAHNKDFFDARNSALQRMKRLVEDSNLFIEKHERNRLYDAFSEFYFTSATYYYYLQQYAEALFELGNFEQAHSLRLFWVTTPQDQLDESQTIFYHYLKGSAELYPTDNLKEKKMLAFDELFFAWKQAKEGGFNYLEASALQGIANLLLSPTVLELIVARRGHLLEEFAYPVNSNLPVRLAKRSLRIFKKYNSPYQIAGTYVTLAKILNYQGEYEEALKNLSKALSWVNYHHNRYYSGHHEEPDNLVAYDPELKSTNELDWIREGVLSIPEWIAQIREQLSVSYSGMGMKEASDYNRNIYLDLLEFVRQDKELESRYAALQKEESLLNYLLGGTLVAILLAVLLFVWINRYSKKKSTEQVLRLRELLGICQHLAESIPKYDRESDLIQFLENDLFELIKKIFPIKRLKVREKGKYQLQSKELSYALQSPTGTTDLGWLVVEMERVFTREEETQFAILLPYISWSLDHAQTLDLLGEERIILDKQRYLHEKHIVENKRENLVKRACLAIVQGTQPYIDRALNEVNKLLSPGFEKPEVRLLKWKYIEELIVKITEHHAILALWIQMKQGAIGLNIENFELRELFELVGKSKKTFEMHALTFEVKETEAVIKADKALTLFMINTLVENAKKYTEAGGKVELVAKEHADYVEISVCDTGIGLSDADVRRIRDEKVYDSKLIGSEQHSDLLEEAKGDGFGLMNCKGIIEKYKKTNPIFKDCVFSVESKLGVGSRFFFRLPKGIKKRIYFVFLLILPFSSCTLRERVVDEPKQRPESTVNTSNGFQLLDKASMYADSVYFSNLEHSYEKSIQYADSALLYLNRHYLDNIYSSTPRLLLLFDLSLPAELTWWRDLFATDYHIILDIRNEAAVAFLALKNMEAYEYNNYAYTSLYKLLGEDTTLDAFCRKLEKSATSKLILITIGVFILLVILGGYYFLILRKRLTYRWNLEQVLDINREVSKASVSGSFEFEENDEVELELNRVPQRIIDGIFNALNELLAVDSIFIALKQREEGFSYCSTEEGIEGEFRENVDEVFRSQRSKTTGRQTLLPLTVEVATEKEKIGVLGIVQREGYSVEADLLFLKIVANYISIVLYNKVLKVGSKYEAIELAADYSRRALWEGNLLHIQNMVLDNCLSAIKHETIYYPNKIKQLIDRLDLLNLSQADEEKNLMSIKELLSYYRGVFMLLTRCATKQAEEALFKRERVEVKSLFQTAQVAFNRMHKRGNLSYTLALKGEERLVVLGDGILLNFLIEVLLEEASHSLKEGILLLSAKEEERFVRFTLFDSRREYTQEELDKLFDPKLEGMKQREQDELKGTEFLICKQIIRMHDAHTGIRGCRIFAEQGEGSGYQLVFTLPKVN